MTWFGPPPSVEFSTLFIFDGFPYAKHHLYLSVEVDIVVAIRISLKVVVRN